MGRSGRGETTDQILSLTDRIGLRTEDRNRFRLSPSWFGGQRSLHTPQGKPSTTRTSDLQVRNRLGHVEKDVETRDLRFGWTGPNGAFQARVSPRNRS